ncbi:hypothetical protein [Flavobacterium sp. H122]|uniref:hypothetical protein n=1 Tax=Flavobacterium sp. H122 TaxID=2529860 RepID=UPI0010A9CC75|nr:hypothetical protein [Flavobacterium sp. H122]
MQEEDELFVQVIKDSKKRIQVLRLLGNFFNHADFVGVTIRTQIIHDLFETNRQLDFNKLELFHIQYTNSLIDLFQKLKKSKEQQYLLVSNEIYINEDYIKRLSSGLEETKFPELMKSHAQQMSHKIEKLYKILALDLTEHFSWEEITNVSNSVQKEYYRSIPVEQYEQLTCQNRKVYENAFCKFERKLLGKLNILKFRIKFLCGLECNDHVIEVYEFRDSNDKFIFIANEKAFYLLDEKDVNGIDLSKNHSSQNQIITQLKIKNEALKEQLGKIKTTLPDDVEEVLKSYLDKISTVDFLEELQNVDEQTNILKAMLNININSK